VYSMKKTILGLLSILTISLLLVGCGQQDIELVDEEGNVVGEAIGIRSGIRSSSYQLKLKSTPQLEVARDKLECKTFYNLESTADCQEKGYDACTSATFISSIFQDGEESLEVIPMDCDQPYREENFKKIIADRRGVNLSEIELGDDDSYVTCCKIS